MPNERAEPSRAGLGGDESTIVLPRVTILELPHSHDIDFLIVHSRQRGNSLLVTVPTMESF
jgi:hypothetical protein